MVDEIRLLNFAFDDVLIGGVGDLRMKSRIVCKMFDVLPHAGREIVDNRDLVALR